MSYNLDLMPVVLAQLKTHRFHFDSEMTLQLGIEQVLVNANFAFRREYPLGKDFVDFFVGHPTSGPGIAIEVKVGGSLSAVTRQLHRYAEHPDVATIVLATTLLRHNRMPSVMCGKPTHVVVLRSGSF